LIKLSAKKYTIDHVIIESTGVADPAPVAQLFMNNMELQHYYSLDGVICLVDAVNFHLQVEKQPEAIKQLTMADLILINKIDKVNAEEVDPITQYIRTINKMAQIERTTRGNKAVDKLLSLKAYNLKEVEKTFSLTNSFSPVSISPVIAPLNPNRKQNVHAHASHDIQTFSLQFKGALDFLKFNAWFNALISQNGDKLYRSKGIIHSSTSDKKIIFQSVHHEIDGLEGKKWDTEDRENKLVFIDKDLDQAGIRNGVLQCLA